MKLFVPLLAIALIYGADGRSCQCKNKNLFQNDPVLPKSSITHVPGDPEETGKIKPTPEPDEVKADPDMIIDLKPNDPSYDRKSGIKEGFKRLGFLNSCSFPVALGFTGSDKQAQIVDGKCIGENLIVNDRGDRCFFYLKDMPKTLESAESWFIDLTSVTPGDDHIMSANSWACRVDQMESHCPMGSCPPWVGPRAGLTKAEFTLSTTKSDFYDISNIEAISIPTTMYPADVEQNLNDYYENGFPGSGVCEWELDIPSNLEKYMTWIIDPTGQSCETRDDCPQGERCGVTFSTSPPTFGQCGTFNGIASAHLLCISGVQNNLLDCERYGDAISCMGEYSRNSGYTPGVQEGATVCGCPDWESMGINAPPKFPCMVSDEMWTEKSLPFLKVLKDVCPNSYVFAYDDATSTFTSDDAKEYVIEFCPGDSETNFFG